MSASTVPVVNFTKGEFCPELFSRIDTGQYGAGAKSLLNVIIQQQGGVRSRPGTRIIGRLDSQEDEARLIPFQYSSDQSYVLAFQQASMRVMALGGFVTEDDLKIVAMTKANPCVIEVPFHAFSVGDRLYFTGNTGVPELNDREIEVLAVIDADHVSVNVDSTGFADLTDSTGEVRVAAPAPPPAPPPVDPPADPDTPPGTGGGGGADTGGNPPDGIYDGSPLGEIP